MALDTLIVHPDAGGSALVEREAFDKIYSRKGWVLATPEEANAESQRLIAERDKAVQDAAEASAAQTAAELAASGALPEQAQAEEKPSAATAKKTASPPPSS